VRGRLGEGRRVERAAGRRGLDERCGLHRGAHGRSLGHDGPGRLDDDGLVALLEERGEHRRRGGGRLDDRRVVVDRRLDGRHGSGGRGGAHGLAAAAEDVRADDADRAAGGGLGGGLRGPEHVEGDARGGHLDGGAGVAVVDLDAELLHPRRVELDVVADGVLHQRGHLDRRRLVFEEEGLGDGVVGRELEDLAEVGFGRARVVAHAPVGHASEREEADVAGVGRRGAELPLVELDEVVDAALLGEERREEARGVDVARVEGEHLAVEALGVAELAEAPRVGARGAQEEVHPHVGGGDELRAALEEGGEVGPAVAALAEHALVEVDCADVARVDRERRLEELVGLAVAPLALVLEDDPRGAREVRRDEGRVGGVVLRVALVRREDLLPAGLLRREPVLQLRRVGLAAEAHERLDGGERRAVVEQLLLGDARPLPQETRLGGDVRRELDLDVEHAQHRLRLAPLREHEARLRQHERKLLAELVELAADRALLEADPCLLVLRIIQQGAEQSTDLVCAHRLAYSDAPLRG
jgi:hypothetical protein